MIETLCRNCTFNLKDKEGKQEGCHFGRLEKFQKAGISVKDSECGQYKIIGEICNLCFMEDEKFSLEKATEIAIESSNIKYDIILESSLLDDLKNSLKEIASLDIKPKKVIFLNHAKLGGFAEVLNNTGISWESKTGVTLTLTLDDGIDKVNSDYFAFNVKNYEIFNRANNLLNETFIKFYLISGDEGNLVNTKAFKYFVGNMGNFPEKLINTPPELNIGNVVYKWTDLQS